MEFNIIFVLIATARRPASAGWLKTHEARLAAGSHRSFISKAF
jgi:hypothetical protein